MMELFMEHWQEFFLYSFCVSLVLHYIFLLSCDWILHAPEQECGAVEKFRIFERKQLPTDRTDMNSLFIRRIHKTVRRRVYAKEDSEEGTILLHPCASSIRIR